MFLSRFARDKCGQDDRTPKRMGSILKKSYNGKTHKSKPLKTKQLKTKN